MPSPLRRFCLSSPERAWLLSTVFGTGYQPALPALCILVVGQTVNLACGSVGLILNMTGHERDAKTSWTISLTANVVLCVALIPWLGAVGAALASAVATILWNVSLLFQTKRLLGFSPAIV